MRVDSSNNIIPITISIVFFLGEQTSISDSHQFGLLIVKLIVKLIIKLKLKLS